MTNPQSDDALMALIATANMSAFRELFQRHGGHLLGYAQKYVCSRDRAEDITQEVWMKVIRLSSSYNSKGHFVAWLYTLTRNMCLNELRGEKRLVHIESGSEEESALEQIPSAQSLEDEILRKENWGELKTAIDALPETQRIALLMYAVDDMSYEDIARELGSTVPSVKSLIFRARTQIAKLSNSTATATLRGGR